MKTPSARKPIRAKARLILANCERVLLEEIASPEFKRRDVALTYRLAMASGEDVDWKAVNLAIIERWSGAALDYIKRLAWSAAWSDQRRSKSRAKPGVGKGGRGG